MASINPINPIKSGAAINNAAGPCQLQGIRLFNTTGTLTYVALFDGATAGTAAATVDRRDIYVVQPNAYIIVPATGQAQAKFLINLNWLAYTGADPDVYTSIAAAGAILASFQTSAAGGIGAI